VVLLPDTLMKGGRYDEALAWCDRVSEKVSQTNGVSRAICNNWFEIQKNVGKPRLQQFDP